ncbi:MAG: RidA family protein [Pseudomonadota bacterium]
MESTPSIERLHIGARLSEVAIFQNTIYLAGQIAEDTSQDIGGQTSEILGHIDRLLAEAGSDKTRILMCQIFITNLDHFAAMNAVWDAWVPAGHAPPRATVVAQLAKPEWLLEIVVTAARKN